MKLTADRVLRALSRFDSATVPDVAAALHHHVQRSVWKHLQTFVADGLATREGERGQVARYAITDAGRESLRRAA